jgi:hypothetical protein
MEKQKYTVNIEFTPGSQFQGEIFEEYLKSLLTALNMHFSTNHKKNKIKIVWERNETPRFV